MRSRRCTTFTPPKRILNIVAVRSFFLCPHESLLACVRSPRQIVSLACNFINIRLLPITNDVSHNCICVIYANCTGQFVQIGFRKIFGPTDTAGINELFYTMTFANYCGTIPCDLACKTFCACTCRTGQTVGIVHVARGWHTPLMRTNPLVTVGATFEGTIANWSWARPCNFAIIARRACAGQPSFMI